MTCATKDYIQQYYYMNWRSGPLSTDPASQLDILGHDGDPLGVNGTEVGVLKKADKVSLGGLLQGSDGS